MKKILISVAGLVIALILAAVLVSNLRPDVAYQAAMDLERSLAGLEEKAIEVGGLHWRYLEGGTGGGVPVLVLVHGFSADKDNWVRVARRLDHAFHLVVPDLIGFGESDRPVDLDYRIEAQAIRLLAFLDTLGIERAWFGGSSMGGAVVGAIAGTHPERVTALWLVAPAGVSKAQPSEMFLQILGGGSNPLVPETTEAFRRTLDFVFTEPPFLTPSVARYLAERQVARRAILETIFADLRNDDWSLEAGLRGKPVPALIVWGSEDRVLHPSGAMVLDAIMPAAEVRLVEGAGHLPMIERPAETAAHLLEFRTALAQ